MTDRWNPGPSEPLMPMTSSTCPTRPTRPTRPLPKRTGGWLAEIATHTSTQTDQAAQKSVHSLGRTLSNLSLGTAGQLDVSFDRS